jgi:hypothetical protein
MDQDMQLVDTRGQRLDSGVVPNVQCLKSETLVSWRGFEITNRDGRASVAESAAKSSTNPTGAATDQHVLAGYREVGGAHGSSPPGRHAEALSIRAFLVKGRSLAIVNQ